MEKKQDTEAAFQEFVKILPGEKFLKLKVILKGQYGPVSCWKEEK